MDAKTKGGNESKSGSAREEILKALSGLQYGQVVIQIKDGKVIQIDRTEKKRLPRLEGVGGDGI